MMLGRITTLLVGILVMGLPQVSAGEPVRAAPAGQQGLLEQDSLSIRGNRALPKTLYIAPWKRLGAPLEGSGFDGRGGERFDPVERDLFVRELQLHRKGYSVEAPRD